jgi:predicted deacetylase
MLREPRVEPLSQVMPVALVMPAPPAERTLAVSFCDLAPCSQRACQEFLSQLARAGVPRATLLLVPRWHGVEAVAERPYFARFVRSLAEAGHEICLHGHTHPAAAAAEFGRLDRGEAERKLAEGAAVLGELGLPLAGFAPPGGSASAGTRAALARLGFAYAASSAGVERLPGGPLLPVATVGVGGEGAWVAMRRLVLRARFAACREAPRLGVAFHPRDLFQPALCATLFGLVREALASRLPVTLGELAATAAAGVFAAP